MSVNIFNALMTHKFKVRKLDRNVSGDFFDLDSWEVNGFIEFGNKIVKNKKDEDVLVTALIFLQNDCNIDINWEYWAIDQLKPSIKNNMEIIHIEKIDDPRNGKTHHFEIFLQ